MGKKPSPSGENFSRPEGPVGDYSVLKSKVFHAAHKLPPLESNGFQAAGPLVISIKL